MYKKYNAENISFYLKLTSMFSNDPGIFQFLLNYMLNYTNFQKTDAILNLFFE